jgi:CubicO group peptidase (beta-lactamase class C family)
MGWSDVVDGLGDMLRAVWGVWRDFFGTTIGMKESSGILGEGRRAGRLAGLKPGAYMLVLTLLAGIVCSAGKIVDLDISTQMDGIFSSVVAPDGPGAAVLVRKDGRNVFVRGYGVRDLRSGVKIDAGTNFRLASCTKQFTAMAIMLLVHDGKLRYDETLTEIFPEFPAYGKAITIRNLLNHTSVLADYEALMETEERRGGSRWNEEKQIQDAEVLGLLERENKTRFASGAKWAYSNSGYVMLGLVVAKVSGKTFGEFLRERIFIPLKMNGTLAFERRKNEVSNRAYGHSREGDEWKQTDQSSTSATLGDGGVYSSLADLAKWDEALAQRTLLSEGEMQAALTPVKLVDGSQPKWPADSDRPAGTAVAYGFGWFLDPYRGHSRMWHYGDTRGFHTYIERFRDERLTIVVLCNRTDLDPEALAAKIA